MFGTNKKTHERIKNSFGKAKEEIQSLKEIISGIKEKDFPRIDRLETLQRTNDDVLQRHWEWIQHHKDQLHEHRVNTIEVKSKLQKIERSTEKFEALIEKIEKFDEIANRIRELEKKMEELEIDPHVERDQTKSGKNSPVSPMMQTKNQLKTASATETINSLRPNERRVFGILFSQFSKVESGWVAFADLIKHAYPTQNDNKIATSLLAKAMKPLYDIKLVEKQKRKNSAFIRPTRFGLDAAKEVGMIEQKKKLDSLYERLAS